MTTAREEPLTIHLGADVKARLQAAAESKGVEVSRYCLDAIERELDREDSETSTPPRKPFDIDDLLAYRDELLGDRVFPGDSVDFIREGREQRTKQLEEWR